MDELYRQEWPGNIRQLRNTVFRAMVLANGVLVQRRDVVAALAVGGSSSSPSVGGGGVESPAAPLPPGEAGRVLVPQVAAEPPSAPVALEPRPAEPLVVLPPPPAHLAAPVDPGDSGSLAAAGSNSAAVGVGSDPAGELPDRLCELLRAVVKAGSYSTQQHMAAEGLSHRTALRDFQTLLAAGLVERVGSRRGAYYRPNSAAGRFLDAKNQA
jgi:hypothetical protein